MADESLSIDETVALLRQHASTVPEDSDTSDAGRTLIHSRLGGIGADWDLDDAVALAERAQWRGWIGSLLGHDLGIEVADSDFMGRPKVRLYAFDVPAPRLSADGFLDLVADTIVCLADGGHVVKRKDAPWDEAVIEWAQRRCAVVDCEIVDEDEPLRVCERDGEPLVWTFEFAGSEWFCVACGGHEDLFGARAAATPERQQRLDELTEQYERASAERMGREYEPRPTAGDEGVTLPTCGGCGATPEVGIELVGGKPRAWFSRTIDGVTSYACSLACIPEREAVMPW